MARRERRNTASYNAEYPVVGWDDWTRQDFQNVNQGLVTMDSNPHDRQSATVATGVDPFGPHWKGTCQLPQLHGLARAG